ncbi:cytochrome c biogenesis CcdA family protein [Sphingomicrobium sediminis]|uniref:Cytochrome c biogenesis CcdA family protein n=1 Tax=Sphingomicrobium sediminis TaxID=2950949 RepID=A0A9X2EFE0_9SPHN|nr:cytochrome c biogenesis CcdA family protein [Sphingomicrobium sediminis]MCM8556537.1 cytochrome c biogenesis CcdA family protein [Sphingomicrobium sediminis]
MLASLGLAFIAGVVTLLNPCVLPILPVLIGSALGQHKLGPLALAAGLVTSFSTVGLAIIAFGFSIGLDGALVRSIAGALLALAGIVLLVPKAQAALSAAAAPLTARANDKLTTVSGDGLLGQYGIGLLLGLVWAPCVGPTLGVAIAAASAGENLGQAFLTFLVFGLGVALAILALAYGARTTLGERSGMARKLSRIAKPLFGAMLVIVGAAVLTGFDKAVEAALLEVLPQGLIEFTTRF